MNELVKPSGEPSDIDYGINNFESTINELLAPYPQLRDLVLLIYRESNKSSAHKNAGTKGAQLASSRASDRDVMPGLDLSMDQVTLNQILGDKNKKTGRLELLIANCHRMLTGMEQRWTTPITPSFILSTFQRATGNGNEGVPEWDQELVPIMMFMRKALVVRQIQAAAQAIFTAKESIVRGRLGLSDAQVIPSDAYSRYPYLDYYEIDQVSAVANGSLDPKSLSVDSPNVDADKILSADINGQAIRVIDVDKS